MSGVSTSAVAPVHVVLAVKDLLQAKTRLVGAVATEQRAALVLAMLTDTLNAALRCPNVAAAHVVTRDREVAAAAQHCGASVLADPEHEGLNNALQHAANVVGVRPVLALQPDLPALRAGELGAAITAARSQARRCFTADRDGSGTTMLISLDDALQPLFGVDSAAQHRASGAQPLTGSWPRLRCDVDTIADVAAALQLGVGSATGAVLDGWGTPATVAEHADGVIALRADDGRTLRSTEAAAQLGGWRQLRPGQRVRVHQDRNDTVLLLTAPSSTPPG